MKSIRQSVVHFEGRAAFTLVEMLVAVALVLLLLTIFTQIFAVATSSVLTQRVISENDQKVRSISTVIRGDVAKRTFTYPLPFYPGEDSTTSPTSFGNRGGYFYLNTNDPASFSDDLLQFTVDARLRSENVDATEYFGVAAPLSDRLAVGTEPESDLSASPNQPDVDGGSLSPDFSASSPAAQIAYFIRNGNLYRRVVLIRNPIDVAGRELDSQPTSFSGHDFFAGVANDGLFQIFGPATPVPSPYGDGVTVAPPNQRSHLTARYNDFARFFDFSAIARSFGNPDQRAGFLGMQSLSNELSSTGAANESFGDVRFRYGFDQVTGRSREFDNLTNRYFIGRYTHAETSTPCFNWPQRLATVERLSHQQNAADLGVDPGKSGNPFDILNHSVELDLNTGLVKEFDGKDSSEVLREGRGGPRQMEDLLLANVQEMRLEVWDDRIKRFVAPGYGEITPRPGFALSDPDPLVGDFHIRRNLQFDNVNGTNVKFWNGPLSPYRPLPADTPRESDRQPHAFDTWHPAVAINFDGIPGLSLHEIMPPYLPYRFSPPRQPAGPSSPLTPDDPAPPVNRGYWRANDSSFAIGQVVFTPWVDAAPFDGIFSFNEIAEPKFAIAYRCISPGTTGTTPPTLATPGQRFSDGTVVWESFDNRVPLKTMRMTITFVNETSGDPRHLTLVMPLGN